MTIRELMSAGLMTMRPETPILEARDLMETQPSLSVREVNHLLDKLTVGQIMTQSVVAVGPDRPARDGARLMLDHRIDALPVLDEGQLIGIITETDIVRAFVQMTASVPSGRH